MNALLKLILWLHWCAICLSSNSYRENVRNACLSAHRYLENTAQQVYYEKFLSDDDAEWLSSEVRASYSEMEARSKKSRLHPLSNVPFLTHYLNSLVHGDILPDMSRRYGFADRLLGIKEIYFEIQSKGVKKKKETLVAASKKNTGDLTFVILLSNTNAGSGNLQVFNMTTVREDAYLHDLDESQLMFNNEDIIHSTDHKPEDIELFDHARLASLDPKCLENCSASPECSNAKRYGPIHPVSDESSAIDIQLSEGESVFFPAQRYYRINPAIWVNGTDPIIYLVGIISIATDSACQDILSIDKPMTLGGATMAAASASRPVILAVILSFLIVVGAILVLVDRFNVSTKRKRY